VVKPEFGAEREPDVPVAEVEPLAPEVPSAPWLPADRHPVSVISCSWLLAVVEDRVDRDDDCVPLRVVEPLWLEVLPVDWLEVLPVEPPCAGVVPCVEPRRSVDPPDVVDPDCAPSIAVQPSSIATTAPDPALFM
jgi:hypothetical protein